MLKTFTALMALVCLGLGVVQAVGMSRGPDGRELAYWIQFASAAICYGCAGFHVCIFLEARRKGL